MDGHYGSEVGYEDYLSKNADAPNYADGIIIPNCMHVSLIKLLR